MEEKKAKERKLKEIRDPVYRLQSMIDKKGFMAKIELEKELQEEKKRQLKANFRSDTTKEDVESFLGIL